jgi:HAE1 family hydrophobic/amphiphilic exporter-1
MALEFDKSTSIQQNNLIAQKIETYIINNLKYLTVFSNIGGPSTGIGSLGVGSANKTEFTIQLNIKKMNCEKRLLDLAKSNLQKSL